MKLVMKRIFMVFISLIILFFLIFFTPDLPLKKLEDSYFTAYSHYIDLNIQSLEDETLSIQIHYQDLGLPSSPVIMLLHGAFSSSHTFLPWANELVDEGYRVILPDLPFFGLSSGFEDQVTSFRRSAFVMFRLLEALSIDQVHIGGNSLGGAVSWFFASEYQQHTQSLILIDALPGNYEGGRNEVSSLLRTDFVSTIASQMTPKFLVRLLLKTAYGDPDFLTKEILNRYYDLLRREHTRKSILQNTDEPEPLWTYEERLSSIEVPTLLLWGMKDTWITPDAMDIFITLMTIPDDHIITYDDLGHIPMEEDPNTVLDYLLFLSSLNS